MHLVRKPDHTWRLCIDFKNLNDATESMETWPLQNIPIMIDRVTQHRPRLHGKVDMTSGFFQTAIDERSRPFTAFITSTGLFQWCRLPMGLKGAASYFQHMMAGKVLAGLLYIYVDLYLDDVLVYATNDDELLERLRIVFERFRQFNITLNPKKCYFGLAEVEFVDHVLKSDGVCFSTEKKTKVLDFALTVKQKQLKSFLGLVSYFRDEIQGLSHKVKSLNDIMIPYKKGTFIDWTPRLEQCFRDVQESVVGKCPKLFYVDLSLPIHVRTDASDYGIGGYIFQLDQQQELPIRIISKALHKAQLSWSTFEKEAYAIFYTITKFDFLLRDVRFVAETDHKHLTFLKTAQSAKVRRWQLALQEFDFEYIHIKGADNVVADAFSRLYYDHHPMDKMAKTERLTAFLMSGDSIGSNAPTFEPRSTSNSGKPVNTEPTIDPNLRTKIEAVHNSVSGHFSVEYTRKVLLREGVNDEGLRRAATKFVRD